MGRAGALAALYEDQLFTEVEFDDTDSSVVDGQTYYRNHCAQFHGPRERINQITVVIPPASTCTVLSAETTEKPT